MSSDERSIYLSRVVQHLIPIEFNANKEEKKNDRLPVVVPGTPTVEVNARRNAAGWGRSFEEKVTYDELLHCLVLLKFIADVNKLWGV